MHMHRDISLTPGYPFDLLGISRLHQSPTDIHRYFLLFSLLFVSFAVSNAGIKVSYVCPVDTAAGSYDIAAGIKVSYACPVDTAAGAYFTVGGIKVSKCLAVSVVKGSCRYCGMGILYCGGYCCIEIPGCQRCKELISILQRGHTLLRRVHTILRWALKNRMPIVSIRRRVHTILRRALKTVYLSCRYCSGCIRTCGGH